MNHSQLDFPGLSFTPNHTLGDLCLIIDLQNVYLPNQPWACCSCKDAITNIRKLIDTKACDNYIFTKYIAPTNPYGTWKNYNETYSEINSTPWLNEIVDELIPYTKNYPVFSKSTYSSYHNTEVAKLCGMADRVIITGVVAECCVLATMFSAIDAGHSVIYLKDAVSGLSKESEAMTETLASNFSPIHTKIMTAKDYISSIK